MFDFASGLKSDARALSNRLPHVKPLEADTHIELVPGETPADERITIDGGVEIRLHDYRAIYGYTGPDGQGNLYDAVLLKLGYASASYLAAALAARFKELSLQPQNVVALDIGAGSGWLGELMRTIGVGHVIGEDCIEAAREAARRDRPGIYDDYIVYDDLNLNPDSQAALGETVRNKGVNCLVSAAAIGSGHIASPVLEALAANLPLCGVIGITSPPNVAMFGALAGDVLRTQFSWAKPVLVPHRWTMEAANLEPADRNIRNSAHMRWYNVLIGHKTSS
jgi:hypothetical protein